MSRKIIEFINVVKGMHSINSVDNMLNLIKPFMTPNMKIYLSYMAEKYNFGQKVYYKKNIKINFKLSIIDECQICLENTQLYSFKCHDKHICCFYCINNTDKCYYCRTEVEGKIKTFEQLIFETILISYYNHFILNKINFKNCDLYQSFVLFIYMSLYH